MTNQTSNTLYQFTLENGLSVVVRPVTPEDAGYLLDLFEHLSPASRYQRFNESLTNPDPTFVREQAQRMAMVDVQAGAAFLAFADLPERRQVPVAGARYLYTADKRIAEVSIAVRDDLQRHHLGTRLLEFVAQKAHTAGVERLKATFNTDNRAVWRLVHNTPYASSVTVDGSDSEVIIHLKQPAQAGDEALHQTIIHPKAHVGLAKETTMTPTLFKLANGLEIRLRPKTANDLVKLVGLLEHGSPEKRFAPASLTVANLADAAQQEALRLIDLAPGEGSVWLAFADLPERSDCLVASGRFLRCNLDEAELSVVVRDDMQGQGIGSKVLYYVLEQARAAGIKRMSACFSSDNEAVWQILSYSPYHVTWQPRGKQVDVTIHLLAGQGMPAIPGLASLN
ncbi:MAG: GNAT family N-acetyltransferase [Caldilineales bacterium]